MEEEHEESSGISAEERQQITEEIDRIMAENRIEVSPETLSYTPRRRGGLLPLFSTLGIIAVVAGGLLVISYFLNRQEQSLASQGATVLTAESKLIAALRQESEAQLQDRDKKIIDAQVKLDAVSKEKEQLRSQTDALIKAREQQLTAEFDKTLAAERDRLQSQGIDEAAVAQKMKDFEEAERKRLDNQVAASRKQAEADLAAKQQAMDSLQAQYAHDLDVARQDRIALQQQAEKKEADLQSQLAQNARQAASAQAEVGAELARLRAQQDREKLILDQLDAGYGRVNDSLQASRYDQALDGIAALRKLLDSDTASSLPAIQRRRGVDLFLIDSLEELTKDRQEKSSTDMAALVQASSLIGAASDLIQHGDELFSNGDQEGARQAYEQAMTKIPAVASGYGKLEDMRTAAERKSADEVATTVRQGNVFYQAGNFKGAVDRYQQTLGLLLNDKALSRQITDSLMNAGYRILAADSLSQLARLSSADQKRQALSARLTDIRGQYKAYVTLAPTAAASRSTADALATLLQARILLRQVLDTESIHAKYPDLSGQIDRYIDAVAANAKEEGRSESLQGLDKLLSQMQSSDKGTKLDLSQVALTGETDPILRLLDRLQVMLQ